MAYGNEVVLGWGLSEYAAVGIALGVRHVLEALNENGYLIDTLHVTGGFGSKPPSFAGTDAHNFYGSLQELINEFFGF